MQHMLAHYGSLGATEDTTIPAVTDPGWVINNNNYQMPQDMSLVYALCLGNLLLRTRLITPFTQQVTSPYLVPSYKSNAINPVIFNPVSFRDRPFPLKRSERVNVAATNSGAGPTGTYAFLVVEDRFVPAPVGDIWTVRGTGATALTANAWSTTVMTWTFNLPEGTYAVVGGYGYSATGMAMRLTFPGQFFKPGFWVGTDKTYVPWMPQLRGELGQLGSFDLNTTPTVEFFASAADATQEVYLQLIRQR